MSSLARVTACWLTEYDATPHSGRRRRTADLTRRPVAISRHGGRADHGRALDARHDDDQRAAASSAAAYQHTREVRPELGRRVEIVGRVGAVGGSLGRVRDRRTAGQGRFHPRGPEGARPHVDERDARRTVAAHRDRADRRPVLRPPVELLVGEATGTHLGHADLGEHLVGLQRGLEEVDEQVVGADRSLTCRSSRHH